MVFHLTYRRLFGKRRVFLAFVLVIISITYICYQAFSIRKLGEELSAEHVKNKDFYNSFQSYQKADFPVHLLSVGHQQFKLGDPAAAPVKDHGMRIRGVLKEDVQRYIPNSRGNFKCVSSSEEIAYPRVNDDFCDCQDGSDEPSTSACHNGRFYCEHQPSSPFKKNHVLSSRVNDGICDCCDGSDEWGKVKLPAHSRIDDYYEKKLGMDQVPCRNRCKANPQKLERGL